MPSYLWHITGFQRVQLIVVTYIRRPIRFKKGRDALYRMEGRVEPPFFE